MPAFGASSSSPAFGASSSSFGDEVYLRYVVNVLVLSPTPALGATRSPFSFGSTPAFSQSTPAFGSSPFGTGTSAFGAPSSPFGGQATTPALGSAGFGQTSFGGQHLGSRVTPYAQTPEADYSSGTHPAGTLASISAMPAHKEKSHEEFRWEDYQLGDKGGPNPAVQFSGGMGFNTNNTQSNPFSSSPAFSHLSANPFSCSNPFAQKTPTFNAPGFGSSTPFGASAYNSFGSTPAPTPSVVGASSTPAFGASSSSFSFGSIPEFSQSTTPGFGSAGFGQSSCRGTRRGSSINSYADSGNSVTQPAEKLESISAMPAYKKKSHEELRWERYQLVDKVGQATIPALSFGGQHGGSRVIPYAQTPEADTSGTHPAGKLESISAMLSFKEKSHEELRWEDYLLGHKGGPNPAGQSSGGMGFNTNNTQSNRFSFPPAFSQLSPNPFSSSTSSNPFAQKTPTFSTPGFGSSTPSVFGSTPGFAATTSASFFGTPSSSPFGTSTSIFGTPSSSPFGTSTSIFGTPSSSPSGTSTSIFGTTQAQGATPSFATGLNFSNTQSSPLFQSSTPSLGQTSSPFGQSTPAFGQSNAFGVNLFSSTPSMLSTSSMGFNQTTPSPSMPFQSAQPTQNSGGFRIAAPAGSHSENGISILNEDPIEALMPRLNHTDYYTEPRIQELAAKERVQPGSCRRVKDFVVGRHGCGSIKFLGETDVRHLDLKSIIQFNHLKVTVYMDDDQKPPVGQGLNKPAEVTLLNVRLYDEQTGRLLTEGPRIEKYKEMLNKIAEDQGGESVSYDPIKGEWKFRVNHFSR